MKNSIFQNNLKALSQNSPNMALKLANIENITADFSLTQSGLGDANLLWNNVLLHDDIDPIEEAQSLVEPLKDNNENTITILFGFGLGYVFKKILQDAKGKVIVYEPDAELLRLVFDIVEFQDDFVKNNVVFVDNKGDLKNAFEKFFFLDSNVRLTFLNSYEALYPKELADLKFDSEFFTGLYTSNYRNFVKYSKFWTHSVVGNFSQVLQHNNLLELKNKFKNKPAVIVSAGPSLDRTANFLKDYEDKAVVFCVGTALKSLDSKGIKPDFLVMVEAHNCITEVDGVDVSDINLILQPMTHSVFHTLGTKRKFNFFQKNDIATKWLCDVLNIDQSEYDSLGTVSFSAMVSAKILGCSPIILIGQDLAYLEGNCYSKGSAFSNLKCLKNPETNRYEIMPDDWEAYLDSLHADKTAPRVSVSDYAKNRLKQMNDGLLYVKSVNGDMLPTEAGYATFISHFESFADANKDDIKLINSSYGAHLEGFEHVPFDEAMKQYCSDQLNVKDVIESSLQVIPFGKKEKNVVHSKINEQIKIIEKTLPYLDYGKVLCADLQQKYSEKDFDSSFVKKTERQLLELIFGLENNYINSNDLYKSLIIPPYFTLKLSFILYDPTVDMPKIIENLARFFDESSASLSEGVFVLKSSGEALDESCNSKS